MSAVFDFASLPLWAVLVSLLASVVIFALGEDRQRTRTAVNLLAAVLKLGLIWVMIEAIRAGQAFEFRLPLLPGLDLVLRADALSLLFMTLSAVLWLLTTIYAIAYLERSPDRARFFGFFSLCVASTMGVATAGNLFTFFIFYELLTLATWPLVAHRGNAASLAGARTYLVYTLSGSSLFLVGLVWLYGIAGSQDFILGGSLAAAATEHPAQLRWVFVLIAVGMGVKAALVPMHGWLPKAMVAPAPVSALLHAVAVVKAGAFGLVRLVEDVYGFDLASSLRLTDALAVAAGFTVVYGSVRALFQSDIKRRLAWSTVSQVSYIALGVSIGGPLALTGGLVHLVHQGLMKITLFFCAGIFAERLGIHRIDELDGVGRRLPWAGAAFSVGALGMIGCRRWQASSASGTWAWAPWPPGSPGCWGCWWPAPCSTRRTSFRCSTASGSRRRRRDGPTNPGSDAASWPG
ncbi:complex I subunit 5 family protein [Alkalisalibacterium limincola]|uniref:complex I subunit 5 family protein n=1 Tax=Alkalisalibacterium limincola TaxID=2699169 RepID=UPI001C9C8346|nr:proton-conducting transporter membrane subunit [Alkalisalibacterium limincola]